MFGGDLNPPKYIKRVRHFPKLHDIELPGTPGHYQHLGREPNTDYHVKLLHYKQRKDNALNEKADSEDKLMREEALKSKYGMHCEKKRLQRQIQDKVDEKLKAYEESVDKRREKLREILCQEERQYYYETVDAAQRGGDIRMEEMKQRANQLRAQREADRLEIVKQKRIQQYTDRCCELKPILFQKHLVETKNTQLQQMRENEARREMEKEFDKMWHKVKMEEIQAKADREEQELLMQKRVQNDMLDVWDKQIQGKHLLKLEEKKVAQEDMIEMEKLKEQLRREEIEALDNKRRKRDQRARELLEQVAQQEAFIAERKRAETALDNAFNQLAELEIQKEKEAISSTTALAKREAALYKQHLKDLEEERKLEAKKLNELLEIHQKEVEKKQDEARCKIVNAKRELQKSVLQGRAEQVEHKRQEAEQRLRLKEAENELLRMAYETNERLQAEYVRSEALAVSQYRDDLRKQIEYNKMYREKESENLEKQLKQGMEEEEKYRKIVEEMIKEMPEGTCKHPFRRTLEQYNCYCTSGKGIPK